MTADFLERLQRDAEATEREEAEFRRASRLRLESLGTERTRLYRRYNFLKDMAAAAAEHREAEAGIAAQLSAAAAETGWSEARTGYDEMRERLTPVAAAIHAHLHPVEESGAAPPADAVAAFADFETWHRQKFGQEFLDLLGRPAPTFQPLVDF